jgi:L-iditol 2-dehydrogenase
MGTMRAAVLHGFEDLRLEEVKIPEPANDGDVLVRIRSCGICATDYKAYRGIRRNVTFPCIIGHEPSGVVASVGRGVRRLKEGDEVIVQPLGHCGLCDHCRSGNTHYCESAFVMGGDGPSDVRPGAFAEYMVAPEGSLFRKPANISFDAAALTEPLAGAWKGTIQYSRMQVGDDVVVIGVGSIGLLCLMVAKAAGAGRLIAIDTSDWALRHARNLGATHTINPTREDANQRVYEIMPDGPDLVMEAAGPIEAVRLMVELRRLGTNWNLFGITTHETFELDGGRTHFLEGRLNASFGTNTLSMVQAIRLMERGLVDTEQIITHRYPLSRIHEAMETMASKERNKVMIQP